MRCFGKAGYRVLFRNGESQESCCNSWEPQAVASAGLSSAPPGAAVACVVSPGIGGAPLSGRGIEAVRGLAAGRFGFSGLLSPWLPARPAGHHGEARQSRGEYSAEKTEE